MKELIIEKLDPIKLPLVQKLYKRFYPSAKPKKNELIYALYHQHTIVAVVRFRTIDRWRLLTGMLVVPEYRGQGIAHHLLEYCHKQVLSENDYCFSYDHLEEFYSQYGFRRPLEEDVPAQLSSLFNRYKNSGKKLSMLKFEILTEN